MRNFLTLFALIFSASIFTTNVFAGTINFAEYANDNEGGVMRFNALSFDTDDKLQFFSGQVVGQNGGEVVESFFFSYFQPGKNGKPGGLGVCRDLNGLPAIFIPLGECAVDGESIVDGASGLNEAISFVINERQSGYNLRGLSFRDANFDSLNNSDGQLTVQWRAFGSNILSNMNMTFAEAVMMAAAGGFGTIEFISFSYLDTAFYLELISDVPIPGAIPLLISGLVGLGFASRRKKLA